MLTEPNVRRSQMPACTVSVVVKPASQPANAATYGPPQYAPSAGQAANDHGRQDQQTELADELPPAFHGGDRLPDAGDDRSTAWRTERQPRPSQEPTLPANLPTRDFWAG